MAKLFKRGCVLLAPMAGFTGPDFRLQCRRYGCDGAFTEMVSAKGLSYGNTKTFELLTADEDDRPLGVQLFGSDPKVLSEAVKRVYSDMPELMCVDFNCGCPARKITSNGEGSALMRDLAMASRCISAMAKACELPVTVKFRSGWDDEHLNSREFAVMAEESGAAALILHARTTKQQYSGRADLSRIAEAQAAVHIPVIGNGDIADGADALLMMRETDCFGVMVGRGALGKPWVFEQIKAELDGRSFTAPCEAERMRLALEYAHAVCKRKGDSGIIELRKQLGFYLLGVKNAARIRTELNGALNLDDFERILLDSAEKQNYNK